MTRNQLVTRFQLALVWSTTPSFSVRQDALYVEFFELAGVTIRASVSSSRTFSAWRL